MCAKYRVALFVVAGALSAMAASANAGVVYSTLGNTGPNSAALAGGFTQDDVTISSTAQPLVLARVSIFGGTGVAAAGSLRVSLRGALPNGSGYPLNGTSFGFGTGAINVPAGVFQTVDIPLPNLNVTSSALLVSFTYTGSGTGVGIGYNSGAASVGVNGPFAIAGGFIEFTGTGAPLGFDFELVAAPTPGAAGLLCAGGLVAMRRRRR